MIKKLFIMPYFGPLPEWIEKFELPKGYELVLETDIEKFKKRVKDKLGIDYPGLPGTGKVWDFRATLGVLYEDDIKYGGFDFWGHTDFDCIYGDVDKWITDEFLSELDVHSNHKTYVNGCWSLYRNTPEVNNLFKTVPNWKEYLIHPESNGWVEGAFSRALEQSGLRYKYTFWQGDPWAKVINLEKKDGKLYQDGQEIMMHHFRYSKKWPLKNE